MSDKIIPRKIKEASKRDKGIHIIAAGTGAGKTHAVKTHVWENAHHYANDEEFTEGLFSDYEQEQTKEKPRTVVYVSEKKELVEEVVNEINQKQNTASLPILSREEIWEVIQDEMDKPKKNGNSINEKIKTELRADYKIIKANWEKYKDIRKSLSKEISENMKNDILSEASKLTIELGSQLVQRFSKGLSDDPIKNFVSEVKADKSLHWLKKVFTHDFIEETPSIAMTYKMLLFSARSITGRTEWLEVLQNSKLLIILDEIEEGKRVIRESIIEEAYSSAVPIVESLTDIESSLKRYIPEKGSDKARENYKNAIANLQLSMDDDFPGFSFDKRHFLIGDEIGQLFKSKMKLSFFNTFRNTYTSKQASQDLILSIKQDGEVELIKKSDESDTQNSISLRDFMLKGSGKINYYSQGVITAATSFAESIKNTDPDEINKAGKDSKKRSKTMKSWLKLDPESPLALTSKHFKYTTISATKKEKDKSDWSKTYNRSFYKDGFEYTILKEEDYSQFDGFRYQINTTPEDIFLSLALNNPVIMMSATTPLPHHKNINHSYLKEALGDDFFDWTESDAREIEKEMGYEEMSKSINFNVYQSDSKQVDDYVLDSQIQLEDFLTSEGFVVKKETGEEVNKEAADFIQSVKYILTSNLNSLPAEKKSNNGRYYIYYTKNLYKLMKKGVKSAIFFFPPYFTVDILRAIADEIAEHLLPSEKGMFNIQSVKSVDLNRDVKKAYEEQELEEDKTALDELREAYNEGKSVFLVTPYASASKGSNIKWDPREDEELIHILPDGREKDKKRTFEAAVLGPITHAFVLKDKNNKTSISKTELELLYEIEEMYGRDAVSQKEYKTLLGWAINDDGYDENDFKAYGFHMLKSHNAVVRKSYNAYIASMAIQALGRLFRSTGFSKDTIAIISDDTMSCIRQMYYEPEFSQLAQNPLIKNIVNQIKADPVLDEKDTEKENTQMMSEPMRRLENILSTTSSSAETAIKKLVGVGMNSTISEERNNAIKQYDLIREVILKHGAYIPLELGPELKKKYPFFDRIWVRVKDFEFDNFEYWYSNKKTQDGIIYDVSLIEEKGWAHFSNHDRFEERFLVFPQFYNHCQDKGIHVTEQPNENDYYVLNPYSYFSLYKGVLAEEFFFATSDALGLGFKKNDDLETFELADGMSIDKQIAVDVKSYSDPRTNLEDVVRKILLFKADKLNVDTYYVINVDPYTKNVSDEEYLNSMQAEYETAAGNKVKIVVLQLTLTNEDGKIIYHYDNLTKLKTQENK